MIDVKLHDIGEGMHEAEILQFLVKEGDGVKNDEPLVEIQTDKMTAELTAPKAGTVTSIEVQEGDIVEVGDIILKIGNENENNTNSQLSKQTTEKVREPVAAGGPMEEPQSVSTARRVLAAPYTRKIARDNDIDIEKVKGTGPAGRVMDEDVYAYIRQQPSSIETSELEEAQLSIDESGETEESHFFHTEVHSHDSRSFLHTPVAGHSVSINTRAIKDLSDQLGISPFAFLAKSAQVASREYPQVNAFVDEKEQKVRFFTDYHIGVHVENKMQRIENVEKLGLREIERKLEEESSSNNISTFSIFITNNYTRISTALPKGQAATLAVSPEEERPAVLDGEVVIQPYMDTTLFFDTRALNGFEAATFLTRLKQLLENPNLLLVELI